MEGDMDAAAAIGATDIREVMKSQGPIVNTVILRCRPSTSDETNDDDKEESKPAAIEKTEEASETEENPARMILKDLIDELKIDTTPSKSKVSEVLGGPFTFLGQYEEEGVVLMIRKFPDDLEADLKDIFEQEEEEGEFVFAEQLSKNFNIKALKAVCFQREVDTDNMTEKRELVEALVAYQKRLPAYNEHQLQPPLHKARVRGDIVVMKVAETEEELDNDDAPEKDDDVPKEGETTKDDGENGEAGDGAQTDSKDSESTNAAVAVPSNEEFFLDYSKEAYIKFASRTDIPEHDIEEGEESDGEEEEADQEEEEGESAEAAMAGVGNGDDDEEDMDEEDVNDEDKTAMFNLVMNEVLRQYREENGRGPNTAELLELRANIAKELGVEIAKEIDGDWDKMAKENTVPSAKKIAFTKKADQVREYVPDRNEYPSDDDDDEDYDDVEDSENVARSLLYEEEDDDNNVNHEPPTKKLKMSEDEEGDSKPAAVST